MSSRLLQSKVLLLISIALIGQGCKTQADIQRERTVENLNQQIAQGQKSNATATSRIQTVEEHVQRLTGLVEESQYKSGEEKKELLALKEKMTALEENNRRQNEAIKLLTDKVVEQTKYLEDVVKSLATLSEEKAEKPKEASKKNAENAAIDEDEISLSAGIQKFKEKQNESAKNIFLSLLENKKTKRKDKEGALHYLGLIEYRLKKYDEAKVYLSRLFSDYPNSTYNPNGLLYLARSFFELKQKDEARLTLDELNSRFPNSKEAKDGLKLKAKL